MKALDDKVAEYATDIQEVISFQHSDGLSSMGRESLYDSVLTRMSKGRRHTAQQITYLEIAEKALSVYRAAATDIYLQLDAHSKQGLETISGLDEQEDTQAKREIYFANKYAMYFAGQVGLSLLGRGAQDNNLHQESFPLEKAVETNSLENAQILANSISTDLNYVLDDTPSEKIKDDILAGTLQATFTTWVNQFSWETHKEDIERAGLEDLAFSYGNFSIKQEQYQERSSRVIVDPRIRELRPEDIIGDSELKRFLIRQSDLQLKYSFEHKRTPKPVVFSTFTTGDPGCGKTVTAEATMRYFTDRARELNVPAKAQVLSITDFSSTYQNETAIKLREFIENDIKGFEGLVQVYVADADVLFKARGSQGLTPDAEQVIGETFRMMDGTYINNKDGRVRFIMDANYVDEMDDATKSRVMQKLIRMEGFKDPEDFVAYSKMNLLGQQLESAHPQDSWMELGEFLVEQEALSNRELEQIIRTVASRGDEQEDLSGSFEQIEQQHKSYLQNVHPTTIMRAVQEHVEYRAEAEELAAKKRVGEGLARLIENVGKDRGSPQAGAR